MSVGPLFLALLSVAPSMGASSPPSLVQAQEGTVTLEVRVGSSGRGWALIDRGSSDKLEVGDAVLFQPRAGGTFAGTIAEVEERAARVELQDPAFEPPPGTKARIQLPRARFDRVSKPRLIQAPNRVPDASETPPVFENRDEEWQEGDPLLARVRPVRPSERATRITGRTYLSLDHTQASEDDRHDSFGRLGAGVVVENPFGSGGRVQADAEWNYRKVDVPDFDDEEDVELRLDRLSYRHGGTRFDSGSWEYGRFLQSGMVEFGVLDGVEWATRTRNGHRYGASVGFMPEPDQEFQTGSDFQMAAFYRWVADESEQLSAAAGYQKTLHNGATDRDLVVASISRLPRSGWSLLATAWIDFYTDGDDAKGTLLGLTQTYISTGRRWQGGSSLDLVFSHNEFPDIERDEFLPVTDAQLADDHNERLALTSRWQMTRDTRLLSGVGFWIDEDDEGGDAELGIGTRDFLVERGFADILAFGTRGLFQKSVGARFSAGRLLKNGRWAVDYELSQNRLDGFSADNDDLPQHRVRFSRNHIWNKWDLSWRIEGLLYDDENALSVGLYLQRSYY